MTASIKNRIRRGMARAFFACAWADMIEDHPESDSLSGLEITQVMPRSIDIPATDYGYLQHGHNTAGPFRTESVPIRNEHGDRWQARFEGRWRRVHIQLNRLFIVYHGERITIQIEGV